MFPCFLSEIQAFGRLEQDQPFLAERFSTDLHQRKEKKTVSVSSCIIYYIQANTELVSDCDSMPVLLGLFSWGG